jgi:hypothetical protein
VIGLSLLRRKIPTRSKHEEGRKTSDRMFNE